MNAKTLSILAGLTVLVIVAAVFLGREQHDAFPQSGELLFPELMDKINDITEITVESKDDKITLARNEGTWGVEKKDSYPADIEKVKRTLIGMAELRIREPKTKNPELYEKLGLQDKDADDSTSRLVTLKTKDNTQTTTLVVGQQRPAKGTPSLSEMFVRIPEDPQTWLVVGELPLEDTHTEWLDKEILEIQGKRIQRVRIRHPAGEILTIQKAKPDDLDFQIAEMPKGYKINSQFNVNNVATTLATMSLDDVQKDGEVDVTATTGVQAVVETFDGLQVTVHTAKNGETIYGKISATFDPSLIYKVEESSQSTEKEGKKEESQKSSDKKEEEQSKPEPATKKAGEDQDDKASEPPMPKIKSAEEVQKEVALMNKKLSGWVFELPTFRVDNFSKHKKDLITKE